MVIITMLTACSADDVVADAPVTPGSAAENSLTAIAFVGANAPESQVSATQSQAPATRATTSLSAYVDNFTLYGIKQTSASYVTVFDNYNVWYTANTAHTTNTNTNNWEYVSTDKSQSIKYWDYSAPRYVFSAVAGEPATGKFQLDKDNNKVTYTLPDLSTDNLDKTLYFAQYCQVEPTAYTQTVKLEFTPYLCKVRIGFFETMENFTVNGMSFGDNTNADHLIANSSYIDTGEFTLMTDYENKTVSTALTPTKNVSTKDFGAIQYTAKSSDDATENDVLGSSSNTASFANGEGTANEYFVAMLPNENNDKPLTISCTYNAVQPDGTTTIIRNMPAVVPVEFTRWKPGMEYTYIFKITDSAITLVSANQVAIKTWETTDDTEHDVYNW